MKITKKQREEINFLTKHFCKEQPTHEQIEEYISSTVYGRGDTSDKGSGNPLREAKQRLNINVTLWREDMAGGLLPKDELLEDFNCEYGKRIVESTVKSISKSLKR